MRKTLFVYLFVVLAVTLNVRAQSEDKIYLYSPSGAVQIVDTNTLHKITFTEENINLHFDSPDDNIQTISYDTLISFKKKDSGIEDLKFGNIHISMEPPYAMINGEDVIKSVSVYDLNGLLLINETVNAHTVTLSLETVGHGIYIICVFTQNKRHTFKIVK